MEEIPRHKDPEVIEAPVGFGVGQGMFSCACKPCEPASGDPVHASSDAMLVPALPSSQVKGRLAPEDFHAA
jgi:hypothetical protein